MQDPADRHPSAGDEAALRRRLTAHINDGLGVDDILGVIDGGFRDFVPFDRLEYAAVEPDDRTLRTDWVGDDDESGLVAVGTRYTRDDPVSTTPAYRRTFLDNDLVSYASGRPADHPVSLLVADGFRSSISCPLLVRDRVVGFVFFNSRQPEAYLAHHVDLVQDVAGLLAFAIEQGRLNRELTERNEELERVERMRLEFVASVSHELRTPMTAVLGLALEVRDGIDDLERGDLSDLAGIIASQANEAAGIVDDLLVVSQAEAGQLSVEPEIIDATTALCDALVPFPAFAGSMAGLGVDPVLAWADPLRVRQIVRNLSTNALRYGGPTVRATVDVEGDAVVLTVADDGPGIPKEERGLVFETFARSKTTERHPGSIGLGLAVSRSLAEAMGGSLTYDHVEGESRFELRIARHPRRQASGSSLVQQRDPH